MTPLSDSTSSLCILLIALLPLALAGLAIVNTGMGRARSAAQSFLGGLCIVAVASTVYFVFGFSLEGGNGGASHTFFLGSTAWDWLGAQPLFFRGIRWDNSAGVYAASFQMFAVGLTALIPWGAGADRWRVRGACASTVLTAGVFYPVFAHWTWGGGWLAHLGKAFGMGAGFADPGGAATLQVIGGLTALSVAWILGPRTNKFGDQGAPRAIPGHDVICVLFGSLLAGVGWLALNALGGILFVGLSGASLALVEVNTFLSASGALLMALFITRIRFGKPDASLCANGWIAGLVASSAVAAYVQPAPALLVGAFAGGTVPFAVEFMELYCGIDDPSGSIAVHGISGLGGLFALGFLGGLPAGQMLAQLVGIATLVGLMLPVIYLSNSLLNKVVRFRASPEGERLGMDLHELGAGAYPEFVVYSDEFLPR